MEANYRSVYSPENRLLVLIPGSQTYSAMTNQRRSEFCCGLCGNTPNLSSKPASPVILLGREECDCSRALDKRSLETSRKDRNNSFCQQNIDNYRQFNR